MECLCNQHKVTGVQSSILPEGGVYTPGDYQKDVRFSLLPVKTLPKALRTGMQISSKEQKFIKNQVLPGQKGATSRSLWPR